MHSRYDISPDVYPSKRWRVIDTHNNNMPVSTHPNRKQALTVARLLDQIKRGQK